MNRGGVTLIELAVALTIASAALVTGYAGLTTALDRRELALEAARTELNAAAVRNSLRSWLSAAQVPSESTAPLFSGADGEADGLPDDHLTFLTSAMTPLGRGPATVSLYIDRNPETPEQGLVADFRTWLGTRRTRLELLPDADALEVRYRSRLLSGREWHPSWISSSVMPAGIEVTLGSSSGALHPLLRRPLRLALRGGR